MKGFASDEVFNSSENPAHVHQLEVTEAYAHCYFGVVSIFHGFDHFFCAVGRLVTETLLLIFQITLISFLFWGWPDRHE